MKVDAQNETYGVGWGLKTSPAEVLPDQIVAAQSLAVDAITSATVTSKAIVAAVAAGSTWQEKQDQQDSPELMYEYLTSLEGSELINKDLLWPFCENSAANLQWLEDRGIEVIDVEPIHSSLSPMRVHNTKGGGGMTDGIGGQITVPLTQRYEEGGGRIVYNEAANTGLYGKEYPCWHGHRQRGLLWPHRRRQRHQRAGSAQETRRKRPTRRSFAAGGAFPLGYRKYLEKVA